MPDIDPASYVARLETVVELISIVKCLARMGSGVDCGVCPSCQARRLMEEARPAPPIRDTIAETCERCVDRELQEDAYKRSCRARDEG